MSCLLGLLGAGFVLFFRGFRMLWSVLGGVCGGAGRLLGSPDHVTIRVPFGVGHFIREPRTKRRAKGFFLAANFMGSPTTPVYTTPPPPPGSPLKEPELGLIIPHIIVIRGPQGPYIYGLGKRT